MNTLKRRKLLSADPAPIQLPLFADAASLIRVRPEQNEWRFYRMVVWPDLFGRASQSAAQPPSTTSAEPVIKAEASEARNTTAPIRSSTWPTLPSLIRLSTALRNASFASMGRASGVSMNVGQIVLIRMPYGPRSTAIALVIPSIPCLVAQ